MSYLRFFKAPPKPEDISQAEWDKEWIGLEVGLASEFPSSIGYLGEMTLLREYDEGDSTWHPPTAAYSIDTMNRKLHQNLWISREMLIAACNHESPSRLIILNWLKKPAQKNRDFFAVSPAIAEYMP